jgi:hypothetical protein
LKPFSSFSPISAELLFLANTNTDPKQKSQNTKHTTKNKKKTQNTPHKTQNIKPKFKHK